VCRSHGASIRSADFGQKKARRARLGGDLLSRAMDIYIYNIRAVQAFIKKTLQPFCSSRFFRKKSGAAIARGMKNGRIAFQA